MSKAYLLGAMHDGSIRHRTLRISQRDKEYILSVQRLIVSLGGNAWIYREGQTRELFVRRSSIPAFIRRVGSWHPGRARLLDIMQMRLARKRNRLEQSRRPR